MLLSLLECTHVDPASAYDPLSMLSLYPPLSTSHSAVSARAATGRVSRMIPSLCEVERTSSRIPFGDSKHRNTSMNCAATTNFLIVALHRESLASTLGDVDRDTHLLAFPARSSSSACRNTLIAKFST